MVKNEWYETKLTFAVWRPVSIFLIAYCYIVLLGTNIYCLEKRKITKSCALGDQHLLSSEKENHQKLCFWGPTSIVFRKGKSPKIAPLGTNLYCLEKRKVTKNCTFGDQSLLSWENENHQKCALLGTNLYCLEKRENGAKPVVIHGQLNLQTFPDAQRRRCNDSKLIHKVKREGGWTINMDINYSNLPQIQIQMQIQTHTQTQIQRRRQINPRCWAINMDIN